MKEKTKNEKTYYKLKWEKTWVVFNSIKNVGKIMKKLLTPKSKRLKNPSFE